MGLSFRASPLLCSLDNLIPPEASVTISLPSSSPTGVPDMEMWASAKYPTDCFEYNVVCSYSFGVLRPGPGTSIHLFRQTGYRAVSLVPFTPCSPHLRQCRVLLTSPPKCLSTPFNSLPSPGLPPSYIQAGLPTSTQPCLSPLCSILFSSLKQVAFFA